MISKGKRKYLVVQYQPNDVSTPEKTSQWAPWPEPVASMTQFSRHHMAVHHPDNMKFLEKGCSQ